MDLIPVLNCFNGNMTVKHSAVAPLLMKRKARLVFDSKGKEIGLEWIFDGYDAAVFSPHGSKPTRMVGHNSRCDVTAFGGEDAFPGMPVLPSIGFDMRS